jgi:RND superfamily putative drug exporter
MLTLARWCATHRRSVVLLWIVVLIGVGAAWQGVGSHYSSNFTLGKTGAQRAADLLKSRFPAQSGDVDQIVFKTRTGKLSDARVRSEMAPMLAAVARLPHVTGVTSPFDPTAGKRISKDGTIGFATVLFDQRANVLPTSAILKGSRAPRASAPPGSRSSLAARRSSRRSSPRRARRRGSASSPRSSFS